MMMTAASGVVPFFVCDDDDNYDYEVLRYKLENQLNDDDAVQALTLACWLGLGMMMRGIYI